MNRTEKLKKIGETLYWVRETRKCFIVSNGVHKVYLSKTNGEKDLIKSLPKH